MGVHIHQTKKEKSIIKETYNLLPIIDLLDLTNHQDSLVIFDVDEVLITPSSQDDLRQPYRDRLLQSIFKMHDFRFKQLDSVHLSFKHLSPLDGEHIMLELATINKKFLGLDCKGDPMLKSGVVFTSGLDKSIVLEHIFEKYNYYPKTVIFVDDLIENIESLKQTCLKLNIDFYGFHYKAASLIPLPAIDEDLEKLRFEILEKEFTWLTHEKLQDKNYSTRLTV